MADIAMCTQTLCPNAPTCYRIQAKPSEFMQSYGVFNFQMSSKGVVCEHYWPTHRVTTTNKTD